jgi:hypothetical protein
MLAASQTEQLTPALKGFVDRFAGGAEYRTMIAEVLRTAGRTEKAREYCDRMIAEFGLEDASVHARRSDADEGGNSGPPGLIFLDTGIDIPGIPMGGPAATSGPVSQRDSGGTTPRDDAFAVAMEVELTPEAEPLPFFEPTSLGGLDEVEFPIGLSGFEPTELVTDILLPDPTSPLVIEDRPEPITITGARAAAGVCRAGHRRSRLRADAAR